MLYICECSRDPVVFSVLNLNVNTVTIAHKSMRNTRLALSSFAQCMGHEQQLLAHHYFKWTVGSLPPVTLQTVQT